MALQIPRKVADLIRPDAPAAGARSALGLGNVDDTGDADKPISTAVAAALSGKAPAVHSHAASDIASGTLDPARLGTGTPAAGTYVDGGTGAWTALPAGGGGTGSGMAIGDPVASGTAGSVLFVDGEGNLGQDPTHLTYHAATGETRYTETTTLASPKVAYSIQSNLGLTSGNKFDFAYRYGYAGDADGPVVASVRFNTSGGQRGEVSLMSAGDLNGAEMIQALKCDEYGDVVIFHGLQYRGASPIRLGSTNADNPTARIQVSPDGVSNKGLILQSNTHFASWQVSLMQVQDQDTGAINGGIDNGQRWYIGSTANLGGMLSVQAPDITEPAIVVRALPGQEGPHVEFQDSTGTPVSSVTASGAFAGPGPGLTALNASALASGTVPIARLGTGNPSAATVLRGDNTWGPAPGFKDIVAPKGWDNTWRAALAASATAPAVVSFIGHSVPQGYGSSDWANKGYMGLMIDHLKSSYGAQGDFWCTTDSSIFISGVGGGYSWSGTPPWNLPVTPTWYTGFGYTKTSFFFGTTATVATFTSPYTCTAMDIVYHDHTAGTWQYAIDGGTPVTVTTTAVGYKKRIAITGLADAAHSVVFSNPSATNALGLIGIATYRAPAGVAAARLAFGGGRLANYTDGLAANAANSVGLAYQWQSLQGKAGPGLATPTGFGFPSGAHLAVIDHGTNDTANYQQVCDNLAAIINAVRRATPDASILVVGTPYPSQSSDVTPTVSVPDYPLVLAALQATAAAHGAAFASVQARWGSTAFAKGFSPSTNQHPGDAGHQDIADFLGQLVY